MSDFVEVADRVWVARYEWYDTNVSVVAGERGLVVVDTHGSTAAGREVVRDVQRLGVGEVVAVVNTHWHFDHSFGNAAFREAVPQVPVHAHEEAARNLAAWGEDVRRAGAGEQGTRHDEIVATTLVVPDHTFSSARALELGDRLVELVHPGRGHTGGDLVVRVPDADLLLAGDLVEESGPPYFNHDAWPLEWPGTLDLVVALLTGDSVVVPGHGAPVDREFVREQQAALGVVAQTILDLAASGVPAREALAAADWPWPRERLAEAVSRGYAQLPRGGRGLPLV